MYETEDLNLHVFNMITGVNESRTLIKHISSKCEYKLMVKNVVRIKRGIITSDSVNVKIQKDIVCAKKKK